MCSAMPAFSSTSPHCTRGTKHRFIWGLRRSCGESSRAGTGTPGCLCRYGVTLLLGEALKWMSGTLRGGDNSNTAPDFPEVVCVVLLTWSSWQESKNSPSPPPPSLFKQYKVLCKCLKQQQDWEGKEERQTSLLFELCRNRS